VVRDQLGHVGVTLSAGSETPGGGGTIGVMVGPVRVTDAQGSNRVLISSGDDLQSLDGGMILLDAKGETGPPGPAGSRSAIVLSAAERSLVIRSADGRPRVELGPKGGLNLGGGGTDGDLVLRDASGKDRVRLGADEHRLTLLAPDGSSIVELGSSGNLTLGGGGKDADLFLRNGKGETRIHVDAGGSNASATATVFVDGVHGGVTLGGNQVSGDLVLREKGGKTTVHVDGARGDVTLGGGGHAGEIFLKDTSDKVQIHIDGQNGDIVLANADAAEDFEVADAAQLEPGTVMVIDPEDPGGRLRPSETPYDRTVAGVLSGAGDLRPGIVLGRGPARSNRRPLALVGRVHCKVDARGAPIAVGDLLTTSSTPGHAMRASDPQRAFGAVIGKALRPLAEGCATIPILVALQ
jgi:hypothetical protein